MARVRARVVHMYGINTLYHAVAIYTGMHKTLETLETLALRARVSKPVSAVLYIPVYTSTAWYNLYMLPVKIHSWYETRFNFPSLVVYNVLASIFIPALAIQVCVFS